MDNVNEAIARLQTRMDTVERDNERIHNQLDTLSAAMSDSALENEKMSGEIRWIRNTLEGMVKEIAGKKVRAVDLALIGVSLLIGIITAYTSVQMVQLTKAMLVISQAVN